MCDKNNVVLSRFRKLIDSKGKTRQAIAKDLKCDTSTVTKQYNGDLKLSVDYLVKYANYFNVSADYLLGLSEPATSDTDLKGVCEYTGLNESSIKNIVENGHKDELNHIIGNGLLNLLSIMLSELKRYMDSAHECEQARKKAHAEKDLFLMNELTFDIIGKEQFQDLQIFKASKFVSSDFEKWRENYKKELNDNAES